MMNTWVLSALWVGLALIATLIAIWFHMSTALSEIVVGTVAQLIIGAAFGRGGLLEIPSGSRSWLGLAPSYCSNHCGQYILSSAAPASEERPTWEPSTQAAEPETV